jgi:hypothetical protein
VVAVGDPVLAIVVNHDEDRVVEVRLHGAPVELLAPMRFVQDRPSEGIIEELDRKLHRILSRLTDVIVDASDVVTDAVRRPMLPVDVLLEEEERI